MLLIASSPSSSSQPDPNLEGSVEVVKAEPNLEFKFALCQDDQFDLDISYLII